ncbi:MAG: LysR family transcriptional regulator [Lachnospiraceae bacterium]|nr:LysR family transcriptional regulator [Lachnospiraceae bacterium]
MNFSNIEYFLATEKERNITRAANKLHITQQTLSAQIAALEKEVGSILFVRKSPLELTYAGTVFKNYALKAIKEYEALNQELSDVKNEQSGILRIGIGLTRGRVILPDIISTFHKEYPLIQTHILEDSNENIKKMLLDGEIDLACAYFPEVIPGVEIIPFYKEELLLLISKELLKTKGINERLEEFADVPFLVTSSDDIAGRIGEKILSEVDYKPIIRTRSKNMELLLELCVKGEGACFCSDSLYRNVLSKEKQKSLHILQFDGRTVFDISFGYLQSDYHRKANRDFIRIAQKFVG